MDSHHRITLVLLALSCVGLLGIELMIRTQDKTSHATNRLRITCTTSIIADAARAIGGDKVEVYALMGPGIDPHQYKARERDVHQLAHGDIILYHGLHLEGKMAHMFEALTAYRPCVCVTDAIPRSDLIAFNQGDSYDPHIWFDSSLWRIVAQTITQVLCNADPHHQAVYKDNYTAYCSLLDSTDKYIKHQIEHIEVSRRILITAHDAFGYFARCYGFKVIGLQGISTQAEVSISDIRKVAGIIVEHRVPAVFCETCIPQRTLAAVQEAVQAQGRQVALGAELYTDALGPQGTLADTYAGMMRYTIDTLVEALAHTV